MAWNCKVNSQERVNGPWESANPFHSPRYSLAFLSSVRLHHSVLAVYHSPSPSNSSLMRPRTDDDDPLAVALSPPSDESPEARSIRIAREEEALRVSQAIDEAICVERQRYKKNKIVRVLLLGQSESGAYHPSCARYSLSLTPNPGKSTTLRRECCPLVHPCTCVISPVTLRVSTYLHPYGISRGTHTLASHCPVERHSLCTHNPRHTLHSSAADLPRPFALLRTALGLAFLSTDRWKGQGQSPRGHPVRL